MTVKTEHPVHSRVTALIAGQWVPDALPGAGGTDPVGPMGQVIAEMKTASSVRGASLRLLTAAGPGTVETAAARWADELGLELHLLSPGQPQALTELQTKAQRQVWLGASADDLMFQQPGELCDEISLGFCDVLILAWDGLEPGRACRSSRLVVTAAMAMKPVIWVQSSGVVKTLDMIRLSAVQRHLLLTAPLSDQALKSCFTEAAGPAELCSFLDQLFPKKKVAASPDERSSAVGEISSRAGRVHNFMMALVQGKPSKAFKALRAKPITAYRGPAWAGSEDLIGPTPALDEAFDRADVDATVAAGKFRSSVWLSSAAATLAVFAAVAGAIELWFSASGVLWAVIEVFLVGLIIVLLWRVKHKDWHSRWISSRFLAEQLRYARMGLPVLALGKTLFAPFRCLMEDDTGTARLGLISSEVHQLQRCLTELGLPVPARGGPMVVASEPSISHQRDYVLAVIKDQVSYHHRVHADQHKADHVLHTLTVILFCLTGAAVLAHFVLHAKWLLIFTAFFPALAAGIHGLSTSLEISRIAAQSKTIAEGLVELSDAIKMAAQRETGDWQRWLQLRELTRMAAELMSEENGQWQKLVDHQKPKLPA